jgi:hypothetical protein
MKFYDSSMWVMTFLVLVITGCTALASWRHKRERTKRAKKLGELMEKGQSLRSSAPYSEQRDGVPEWEKSVEAWTSETLKTLGTYSRESVAVFNRVSQDPYAQYPFVHPILQQRFDVLLQHLESLKGIMEKPGVYY